VQQKDISIAKQNISAQELTLAGATAAFFSSIAIVMGFGGEVG
jgi:hypothetical protein